MNLQSLFPITLSGHWQTASACQISASLHSWLLDPTSLTARLKEHCQKFRVELLGQHIEYCHDDEVFEGITTENKVIVREVLLYCDEVPHVFARSILPLSSVTGTEESLANLGTQSLGQVLFNNSSLKRKAIEVSPFNTSSTVAQLSKNLGLNVTHDLWGRRSIFVVESKPIMVAEVFLPNAIAYQHHEQSENTYAK